MTSSRGASLLLAGALLLTLGAKAVTRQPPEPDTALFTRTVETRLRDAGYSLSTRTLLSGTYLYGARGACRLMVTEQDAFGTVADRNNQFAREVGPVRFVWRGKTYDAPPRPELLVRFLIRRELVRIGFEPSRQPLALIAAGPGCAPGEGDAAAPVDLSR